MQILDSLSRKISKKFKERKLNKLPKKIKKIVESLFVEEDILLISESDLDLNGNIEKNYLIVTEEHLAVFSFVPDYKVGQKKIRYNSLQLDKIDEIKIEVYQNNAFLTLLVNNNEQQILRFWDTEIYTYEKIASKIIKIISKGSTEAKVFKLY